MTGRMKDRGEILDRSVEELELSVRTYNWLKNANVSTIRDLVQKTEPELLKKRGGGKKVLNEVKEILELMGLGLKSAGLEIEVPDYSSSIEDWNRAQKAARSELPELSDDEKDVARRFKISEEEYARGVLAGDYGRKRKIDRAQRLGEVAQKILDELSGGRDRVVALVYDAGRPRWIVSVQTAHGTSNVAIPLDVADDVLDWGLREQIQQLRSRLAYGLGWERRAKSA